MNPTDTTRFIRWSLPGWIAILFFIICVGLDVVVAPVALPVFTIADAVSNLYGLFQNSGSTALISALIIALGGLPLGFIIYQFYFFFRWNSPFSRDGLLPPFIVGRNDDLEMMLRDITKEELKDGETWREKIVEHPAYEEDHAFKWRYIDAFILEAWQTLDGDSAGMKLNERRRYLVELMHVLGASTVAVYLGFGCYLAVKAVIEPGPTIVLPLLLSTVFLALLFISLEREDKVKKERQKHDRTDKVSISSVFKFEFKGVWKKVFKNVSVEINHVAFLLVYVLGFILILVNPLFTVDTTTLNTTLHTSLPDIPHVDLLSKIGIFTLGILTWVIAIKNQPEKIGLFSVYIICGLVIILPRIFLDQYIVFIGKENWSSSIPGYLMLIVLMTLLKNRQNTRDELTYLEYFILRSFLNKRNQPKTR